MTRRVTVSVVVTDSGLSDAELAQALRETLGRFRGVEVDSVEVEPAG